MRVNDTALRQVCREQEQQLELEKLRRELALKREEALTAQTALQSKEMVSTALLVLILSFS